MSVDLTADNKPSDIMKPKKVIKDGLKISQVIAGMVISESLRGITTKFTKGGMVDDAVHLGLGLLAGSQFKKYKGYTLGFSIAGLMPSVKPVIKKLLDPILPSGNGAPLLGSKPAPKPIPTSAPSRSAPRGANLAMMRLGR